MTINEAKAYRSSAQLTEIDGVSLQPDGDPAGVPYALIRTHGTPRARIGEI